MEIINSPWIIELGNIEKAENILVCFPYAGGLASMFESWNNLINEDTCILAIQLPGRETRYDEVFLPTIEETFRLIADDLEKYITKPFSFFGHSFGALLAFTVSQELRLRGFGEPDVLFVSAKIAPHIPESDQVHTLPDDELIKKLSLYGGTPSIILENKELMNIILPRIRADISLGERFIYKASDKLNSDIIVFGGDKDPLAPIYALEEWKVHTRSNFEMKVFDSDHFFIHSKEKELLQLINKKLGGITNV